jgi:hypothetical protein
LGLAQLLAYLARSTDVATGEMLVKAGHFEFDPPAHLVDRVIGSAASA